MPSYSESSETQHTEELGWALYDGEMGIPKYCFCGRVMKVEESTAELTRGKKFFTCPDSMEQGEHIWKWWDEAVSEELRMINMTLQENAGRMHSVFNIGNHPSHEAVQAHEQALVSMGESLDIYGAEIEELKNQAGRIEVEITRFKNLVVNRAEGYVVLLFLCLVVALSNWFH